MIALIQRVKQAKVVIDGKVFSCIRQGILALVCVEQSDQTPHFAKMCHKLTHLRIFEDCEKKMNLALKDIDGELLIVPQFTLAGDTQKGLRPSFSNVCPPKLAEEIFKNFRRYIKNSYAKTAFGRFGADMQVTLTNDGPVTLWLKT